LSGNVKKYADEFAGEHREKISLAQKLGKEKLKMNGNLSVIFVEK